MDPSVKQPEEEKRARAYNPVTRWRQLQEMISWCEKNMQPQYQHNNPKARAAEEKRKLGK